MFFCSLRKHVNKYIEFLYPRKHKAQKIPYLLIKRLLFLIKHFFLKAETVQISAECPFNTENDHKIPWRPKKQILIVIM
jgi:hypothetical protein